MSPLFPLPSADSSLASPGLIPNTPLSPFPVADLRLQPLLRFPSQHVLSQCRTRGIVFPIRRPRLRPSSLPSPARPTHPASSPVLGQRPPAPQPPGSPNTRQRQQARRRCVAQGAGPGEEPGSEPSLGSSRKLGGVFILVVLPLSSSRGTPEGRGREAGPSPSSVLNST